MADVQVKTANICNITSSTLLNSNAGGSGTYISDNNISVYMSGTATWSGTYCQYTNDYAVVDDYYTISFTPICATNSTLQIEVAGTAKKISFTSGTRTSVTIQATSTSRYVAFYGGDTVEKTVIIKDIQIEKGETATPYHPYSATGWVHSLRKLTTATEAVENPLYSDGTAITAYALKGDTTTEFTGRYIKADYIEFNWGTNGGWIDIGTPVYTDTSWYIDFAIMEAAADNWVCGASNHSIQCAELVGTQDGSSWFTGHHAVYDKAFAVGVRTRATITGDAVYKRSDPFNLYIGCANWATTEDNPTNSSPSRYRVYGLYMTRNGVLQRDMKPVYDTVTRKWGMYDYANNVFYGNAGPSGTSIAGGYYATPPSPSNPVEVNGVGERTENLFDGQLQQGYYAYLTGEYTLADVYVCTHLIPCTENTTYTFRCINTGGGSKNYGYVFFDSAQNRIDSDYINELTEGDVVTHTATTPQNTAFLAINIAYGRRQASVVRPSDITDFMLNTGSTVKPYEPYGYKIPISTPQGTSNIYLSEPLYKIGDYADVINADGTVSRRIAKLTLNGDGSVTWNKSSTYQGSFYAYNALVGGLNLWTPMVCTHATWVYPVDMSHYVYGTCGADGSPPNPNLNLFIGQADWNVTQFNQFLAENPVTVYYVLATATTEQITLPAIATTEGANSITVDTTVQPSEFTATWTGWHNASVQEYTALLPDNPLCGISTYKDTLNLATGAYTRQIKEVVLKGDETETWSMSDSMFGKRFSMTLTGAKQSDTSTVATICSHLPLGVAGATYSETNTYTITAASVLYISRDGTYTSVADFKAWLAAQYTNGTPVTLWYAFAPTETGTITVPSGLSGTEEGYLTQSGTPTPSNPIYPTANTVNIWE